MFLLTILKIGINNMNQLLQLLNTSTDKLLLTWKENISHDFFFSLNILATYPLVFTANFT
jgi:hypothetical protein